MIATICSKKFSFCFRGEGGDVREKAGHIRGDYQEV